MSFKNQIEEALSNPIPLAEAANFFIQIKTAGWADPPDMEGSLEGQFAVPIEAAMAQMSQVVEAKMRKAFGYMVYGQSLRGLEHKSIGMTLEHHAWDETDMVKELLRRLAALGGPIQLKEIEPPPASSDPNDIIQRMIRAEQEGIAATRELLAMVGPDNPMKNMLEGYMSKDQKHLDKLWQHTPQGANPMIIGGGDEGMEGGEEGLPGEEPPAEVPGEEAVPEEVAAQDGAPAPEEALPEEAPPEELPVEEKEASLRMKFAFAKLAAEKKTDKELKEIGRERGVASMAAEAHREKSRRGERYGDLAGRAAGTVGGAMAGKKYLGPYGAPTGAVLGYLGGGKVGREVGTEIDTAKAASMKMAFAKLAQPPPAGAGPEPAAMDQMAQQPQPMPMAPPAPEPPPPPPMPSPTMAPNYLQAEQMGQQAQQANEANFYRGKLEENQGQLQGMQQQVDDAQAQLQSLQQQAAEASSQIQQATDAATQATDQALQQTQMAAKMRMGMQQMRAQMLEVASQEPDAIAEQQQRDQAMAQSQQLQGAPEAGMEGEPPAEGGPAEMAPAPGAPPGAAPGGVGEGEGVSAPAASPEQQMVDPQAAMKMGSAGLLGRLPYAAGGAVLGAAGAGMTPSVENAQKGVDEAEGAPNTFGNSLRKARAKAGLAMAEHAEEHPTGHRIMGGLMGAGMGALGGPSAAATVKGRGSSMMKSLKELAT